MATSTMQRNSVYLQQQFSAALGNSSVVVKFVCVAVTIGYFISFSEAALVYFAVTPGYVLPPNFLIWTFFTHSFIERHIWNVVIDIVIIILYGKLLEPLWGALEMLIFFAVINIGVAGCTALTYMGFYIVTRNEEYLFDYRICGLAGYVAGFSVAVKQIMPDHVLVNSPFGKLRNKHIPLLLLYLAIIVWLIGGVDGPFPIMFAHGLHVSWIYLRFYQKHTNGNRGDMADSFTFASFFPSTIQPFLAVICNSIFSILVKIKLCKKPQRKYDVSAPTTITVSLPGTDPQDAERRRQVALKALNERLSKVNEPTSWPSLDEPGDGANTPPATPEPSGAAEKADSHNPSEKSATQPKLPVPDFKENAKTVNMGDSS